MKMKGEPLEVKFTHVENGSVKKTIARCTIKDSNVPLAVYHEFFELFEPEMNKIVSYYPSVRLYAETTCDPDDTYDPVIGEKIARKKIMKKFMSMVRQAADKKIADLNKQLTKCAELKEFAAKSEIKIIHYLRDQ